METLRKQGKVRAIGVSNYDLEWLRGAKRAAPSLASLQPPYSLIQRRIEKDGTLAFCRENGVALIVYSPLERGLLTGKVTPERKFPPDDHRSTRRAKRRAGGAQRGGDEFHTDAAGATGNPVRFR